MRNEYQSLLAALARKYVWWKRPDEALKLPQRVMAQVMDLGTWDDVLRLAAQVGDDRLRDVLAHAEAGQFSPRSWAYWHYRLGHVETDSVPSMPTRKTA